MPEDNPGGSAPRHRRAGPDGVGRQCAALPLLRENGALRVVLVTSRGTGRWVLPKGWLKAGISGPEMAAIEAFEEAGLRGWVEPLPVGAFDYAKELESETLLPCRVEVFAMEVTEQLGEWPEQGQRIRRAFTPAEAAALVAEPDLAALLRRLD